MGRTHLIRPMAFPVGLLAAALLMLGLGSPAALAQTVGWSSPIPLSDETTTSWFPDIAVDLSGRVHVVWSSGVDLGRGEAYDTVMYASSSDGRAWSLPLDVVALPSEGNVTRPALLTDAAGALHMTYRSNMVYYTRVSTQAVAAPNFLPPRSISSGDNGYFSRLVLDAAGRLHVFYTEYAQPAGCPECLHVYHRVSEDNGLVWSLPEDITPGPSGAAKPSVVVDTQGRLHLVWEAGRGGDLGQLAAPTTAIYVGSDDGGRTWRPPLILAPSDSQARHVTLGMTGTGQLVAAWLSLPEDRILYRTSDDGGLTWAQPQAIPGGYGGWTVYAGRTDGYAMVTDGAGVVHLLAVGRTSALQTSLSLLHMAWDGAAWSTPEALVTLTGDVPEWPRAAVGLGNQLHVVWFVRDEAHIWGGEGAFPYRIWYANRMLDAPAQQPVVFPTLTPTSEVSMLAPEVVPTREATPTSSTGPLLGAFLSPDDAVPPADIENRSLLIILQAMIPVLLFLGGVVVVVNLRRRRVD